MFVKSILVHAEPGPGSDSRVRLASSTAEIFGASLTGLGAQSFEAVFTSGYGAVDGMVIQALRDQIAIDLPAAEARFRALTPGQPGAAWIAEEDYPHKMLALHARGADLIVASRPEAGQSITYAARVSDLVMEAGVPILVAADGDAAFSGERVMVAWKDTRESRRALSDALPFLKRAKAVMIVTVAGEADGEIPGVRQELTRKLAAHGVAPTFAVIPKGKGAVADALEAYAVDQSADLIVAGAYGHTRLREWMLGGVTEDLAASSSRFVLLSH